MAALRRQADPVRAEARCFEPKKSQIPSRPADLIRSVPIPGRKRKKARQILADLPGYLAKPDQHHW